MNTTEEVLAVLPSLSNEERAQVARASEELAAGGAGTQSPPFKPQRIAGSDEGVADDSNHPQPDEAAMLKAEAAMPLPIAGLHEGAWWIAEDAFDPLPDDYWSVNEDEATS